jgi:ribonuclease HI
VKAAIHNPAVFAKNGQVPPSPHYRPAEGVIVATDAATSFQRHRAGLGFVATSGLFGLSAHPQPLGIVGNSATIVAELRAIWRAIAALRDNDDQPASVAIHTDSKDALRYLRAWQSGGTGKFPDGYQLRDQRVSGNESSLEKLAELMAESGGYYTVQRVTGHAGDHLNEAADSLAKLALRSGTRGGLTRAEVLPAATRIAEFRLRDYWLASKSQKGKPA